jgi:hypothetical protein
MTKNEYDKKCHEQKSRQYQISEKIKKYLQADEAFKITNQ